MQIQIFKCFEMLVLIKVLDARIYMPNNNVRGADWGIA